MCYNIVTYITPSMPARNPAAVKPQPAWLIVVLSLQGQHQALRMRLWRGLKGMGAAVIRDGVYLLPNRAEFMLAVQNQADEVVSSGGSAQVLTLDARDSDQERAFRQLFDRSGEYEKLMPKIQELTRALPRLRTSALQTRLDQLRREHESIALQDFFGSALSEPVRIALDEVTARVNALLAPDEPHARRGAVARVDAAQYRGRTWVTRQRPWVDRLASGWLIKRFIDRRARFAWVKNTNRLPKGSVGFDFDGAHFTHIDHRVTFEVLLAAFGLEEDPGLLRIAALVHYLDVGGVPVAEAAGIEALLRGASASLPDDDDGLLVHAAKLFDDLYADFCARAG